MGDVPDGAVVPAGQAFEDAPGPVRGAVVYDDDLPRHILWQGSIQHALDELLDEVALVVDRDENAELHREECSKQPPCGGGGRICKP